MKKNIPIVITSINSPTLAVRKFAKLAGFRLFIVGDNKTPKNYELNNADFFSIKDQHKAYPELSKLIPENSYVRKVFGYLEVIKRYRPDYLFETDDDNIPYANFGQFLLKQTNIPVVITNDLAFNILKLYTHRRAWLRGFPLELLEANLSYQVKQKQVLPLLQEMIADKDTDFDCIYRLAINKAINFKKEQNYALDRGVYGPCNTQSTFWFKKVFSLLYFPSTVPWRTADIWRGYIAQKIIWALKGNLVYLYPRLYQKRLRFKVTSDLQAEVPVLTQASQFLTDLNRISVKGTVEEMLEAVYVYLVKKGYFTRSELKILKLWLSELN